MRYWFDKRHHEFKPFTVSIEVETLEDAADLSHILDPNTSYKYSIDRERLFRDLRNFVHCTANNLNGCWFNVNK